MVQLKVLQQIHPCGGCLLKGLRDGLYKMYIGFVETGKNIVARRCRSLTIHKNIQRVFNFVTPRYIPIFDFRLRSFGRMRFLVTDIFSKHFIPLVIS